MFVSARRIIHRKIYLTLDKNWELLTLPERRRYLSEDRLGLAVKVLPELAAHGVLSYARQLFINLGWDFTPTNLQPFNHYFQCFDRIQELSISRLDTPGFLENFDTYFANVVPTLQSLHLEGPIGETRDILDFICRFPHLDDLSLKMSISTDPRDQRTWSSGTLPVVKSMPPFRGRLKLDGIIERRGSLLQQLTSLPGKRSFRSVVFRNCESEAAQPIVSACCSTLASVSTTWGKFSKHQPTLSQNHHSEDATAERGLPLNLTDATNLRSLTLRASFGIISLPNDVLFQTLSTISSPFFSEFILEVEKVPKNLEPGNDAWGWWGRWAELDEMFERIDMERGFRVVFRAEEVDRELNFTAQAEGQLPLMAARKRVIFEIGPFPEK